MGWVYDSRHHRLEYFLAGGSCLYRIPTRPGSSGALLDSLVRAAECRDLTDADVGRMVRLLLVLRSDPTSPDREGHA